jgi:hypothetical protein
VAGHNVQVASVALQTEQALYPASRPGLVWVTRADAASLAIRSDPLGYELDVKPTRPSATDAFYNGAAFDATNNALIGSSISQSWQAIRN